jgi:ComF family protein
LSNWTARVLNNCASLARRLLAPVCALCGASAENHFCKSCASSLPKLPPARCRVCAVPLASGETCGACLTHAPAYDSVYAAYAYAFPIDALIQSFKYHGNLALARALAAPLAQAATSRVDALLPMPLSAARLRERGFNQAQELARHIGRACNVPILERACRKVADTVPQAALPWGERARNVRRAFVCDANLAGLRVAIVDDVVTTGATLNELARNLKRAGAIHVSGWVVARTLRGDQRRRLDQECLTQ